MKYTQEEIIDLAKNVELEASDASHESSSLSWGTI